MQTVYNHFGDKEVLFTEVTKSVQDQGSVRISDLLERAADGLDRIAGAGEMREPLTTLTAEWIQAVHTGRIVAVRRLIESEGAHHPRILQQWRENGPGRTMPRLNRLLVALGRVGLLDFPPEVAKEPIRLATQPTTTPAADVRRSIEGEKPGLERIRAAVEPGVDYFLRAYAAKKS